MALFFQPTLHIVGCRVVGAAMADKDGGHVTLLMPGADAHFFDPFFRRANPSDRNAHSVACSRKSKRMVVWARLQTADTIANRAAGPGYCRV